MTVLGFQEKHALVYQYARPYGVVVETGLYNGGGASTTIAKAHPDMVCYAIDRQAANVDAARRAGVLAWLGDSGLVLQRLLKTLDRPACFWLDAHDASEGEEVDSSPLLDELHTIMAWPHAEASTVLVDDLRMYGRPGWPTMTAIRSAVGVGNLDMVPRRSYAWDYLEWDDVLRLTPYV